MDQGRQPNKIFYGWWIVVGSFIYGLYSAGAIYFGFTAFFEPIAKEFDWSYGTVAIAASLRGMEMGLLAPLLGMLVDRWGARPLMIVASLIGGLGLIFQSKISSLGMFYAAFILISIGISPAGATVQMAAVANWFKRRAGLAMGIVASGFASGGIMVPMISMAIDTYGWRNVMIAMGLGLWLVGIPVSFIFRHKPEQYGYLPDGGVTNRAIDNPDRSPEIGSEENIPFGRVLKSRVFWFINITSMISFLAIGAVMTHVMPYLSSISIPRSISSLVAGGIPLVSICGRLGSGLLGDIFDKRWVAAASVILITLGLLSSICVTMNGIWFLIPFVFFFGTGWGGITTLRPVLMREYFGRSRLGTILGFSSGVMMVGNIVGSPVAGWVFDYWGSYHGAWYVFAGFVLIATVFVVALPPVKLVETV
ncbi:MFS transporter [Thermodesulfobacteriota bacterium]